MKMKPYSWLLVSIALLACADTMAKDVPGGIPAYISSAVADANRPPSDTAQDANRKPEAVLAFAGIKPKDKIVDWLPGSGYFTRIFSKIVGPKGRVYALQPDEVTKARPDDVQVLNTLANMPAYTNVTVVTQPVATIKLPEQVDMIWTSMNYHDLHASFLGNPDVAKFNKSVFDALKPGGIFLILDHAAAEGSGFTVSNTLHRAEPAAVKAEVLAAGFEFVGESDLQRHPEDDHSLLVFDKSIRGKTDKFIYKFRKPLH